MAKTTSAADTLRTGAARGINNGRLVLQKTQKAAAENTANAANAIKSNASFVYKPSSGSADSSVEALLNGKLVFHPDVMCNHHGEHHGSCGEHGCGEHQEQHHCGGHCHG